MYLIIAIIQPQQLPAVKKALYEANFYNMTCTNVLGTAPDEGEQQTFRGVKHEVELFQKLRLEIAVIEEYVEPIIDAIQKGAQDSGGWGKVFVTELKECVLLKTGERGPHAI